MKILSHRVTLIFTITLFAAASSTVRAGDLTQAEQDAIDFAINQELEKNHISGAAFAIIEGRKVAYHSGYGVADRGAEVPIPVTSETIFNWASNSKPVVAMLAAMLEEEGRLDAGSDIKRYVPEFPDKERGVITSFHLLTHQSGLPHYENADVIPLGAWPSHEEQRDPIHAIRRFSASPLRFAPGTDRLYSTYGYVLLSAVVQRASGQPIQELLNERLVAPLGLKSFCLDDEAIRENWSRAYRWNSTDKKWKLTPDYAHFWKHGGGGYKSDIVDFARWAEALLSYEMVNKERYDTMWGEPTSTEGGRTRIGLGFHVTTQNGRLKVFHNGRQDETSTRLVLYPTSGDGMVVMCNSASADPSDLSTAAYKALYDIRKKGGG